MTLYYIFYAKNFMMNYDIIFNMINDNINCDLLSKDHSYVFDDH